MEGQIIILDKKRLDLKPRLKIQSLETNIVNMMAESLNFWLTKFVQEICKADGQRYPPRSLYSIICGPQRLLGESNGAEAVRLLNKDDRRYKTFYFFYHF